MAESKGEVASSKCRYLCKAEILFFLSLRKGERFARMSQQEVESEIGPMPAIVAMVKKRELWAK